MTDKDYLQKALSYFNTDKHQWCGFRKDFTGSERMTYENLILNDSTASANKKASGKQKLKDLGLDDDEIKALMGA